MAIRGITFSEHRVTAMDHGALFGSMVSDGRIKNGEVSASGTSITVSPGYFVVSGRLIQVNSSETFVIETISGFAQVIMSVVISDDVTITMSLRSAETELDFPALVKEDLNGGGSTCQIELARVRIESGAIAELTKTARSSSHRTFIGPMEPDDWKTGDIWFVTGSGSNG